MHQEQLLMLASAPMTCRFVRQSMQWGNEAVSPSREFCNITAKQQLFKWYCYYLAFLVSFGP